MAAVARADLRRLKLPSSSFDNMAVVARVNLRNSRLPPVSWDSHVHVIDEVGRLFDQAGRTLLTIHRGSLSVLQQPGIPPWRSHCRETSCLLA